MSSEALAIVDAWFHEKVQAAPVAHHTECYNQMQAAWQDLRKRLGAEPEAPPSDEASGQRTEAAEQPASAPKGPGTPPKAGK